MKKVLQISNYMYPHIGGIEQVARDFADALLDKDVEQKIICFNEDAKDDDKECFRGKTVRDSVDGIEVIRCGCFAKISSQSLSFSYPRVLRCVFTEFNPDIVILHYPNPFVSHYLLKILPKSARFILYWHLDIIRQKILGKFFHRQTLALLRRADKVVATSPNYIEGSRYLSLFKNKCVVIPCSIRTERLELTDSIISKVGEIKEANAGKVICFAVGRHVEYKGLVYLVRASKLLDDNVKIYIGGSGPLSASLEKERGDDDKVVFLGRVSDADLIAYYSACDIFCFPSITKNEAFGIALAEAMYFGKPAVTFNIPGSGVNYVNINNETGIECPNCDVLAYAEAIQKLACDSSYREKLGEKARNRIIDNFLYDSFRNAINDLVFKEMDFLV